MNRMMRITNSLKNELSNNAIDRGKIGESLSFCTARSRRQYWLLKTLNGMICMCTFSARSFHYLIINPVEISKFGGD